VIHTTHYEPKGGEPICGEKNPMSCDSDISGVYDCRDCFQAIVAEYRGVVRELTEDHSHGHCECAGCKILAAHP
jgi:hypothetical protein